MLPKRDLNFIKTDPETPKTQLVIVTGLLVIAAIFQELLSKVMNPLILGLLYFLFITPIALLFRLFGNDPLRLKDNKGSLYEVRDHTFKKKDLVNPW